MTTIDVTTEPRSTREVLAWSRTTVEPALRAAVDTLPPSMRHIAGYHFGWWNEHGQPEQADGGKAIRPTLVLLSARAVGGAPAAAVPAAAAVELVHNFSLVHEECLSMVGKKTGALIDCACAMGAFFGGGSPDQVQCLRRFGNHLGLAFQHVDDLLGIWGDPAVTGKPVYSDLRSRKKSLPVVAALPSGTPAGPELAELYQREAPLSDTDLAHAAELIDIAGGRAWSQTQVDDLLAQAMRDLNSANLTRRAGRELGALAQLATHRDN